jgi:hypothetical protein
MLRIHQHAGEVEGASIARCRVHAQPAARPFERWLWTFPDLATSGVLSADALLGVRGGVALEASG